MTDTNADTELPETVPLKPAGDFEPVDTDGQSETIAFPSGKPTAVVDYYPTSFYSQVRVWVWVGGFCGLRRAATAWAVISAAVMYECDISHGMW